MIDLNMTNKEAVLTAEIPADVKNQLKLWRDIKDIIEIIETESKPFREKLKEVANEVQRNLAIDEGEMKSETVSVEGSATAWKNKITGLTVNDFSAFQNYLTRNNLEFVMRKQVNLAGVSELQQMVMEGEVPMPQSAEFTSFEKITIRKR